MNIPVTFPNSMVVNSGLLSSFKKDAKVENKSHRHIIVLNCYLIGLGWCLETSI